MLIAARCRLGRNARQQMPPLVSGRAIVDSMRFAILLMVAGCGPAQSPRPTPGNHPAASASTSQPESLQRTAPVQATGALQQGNEPSLQDSGDVDQDGLKNSVDACPRRAEDYDAFEDEDGCPDLDNDRDGVIDADDRCPNEPEDMDGHEDLDGCPEGIATDRDGDGKLDAQDMCPDDPEDRDGFEDQDGCPDPDNDQDGILDRDDLCPSDAEDGDGFQDEDGCPDPDNDMDRVLDVDDKCPNEPENYNGKQDSDGCPDRP